MIGPSHCTRCFIGHLTRITNPIFITVSLITIGYSRAVVAGIVNTILIWIGEIIKRIARITVTIAICIILIIIGNSRAIILLVNNTIAITIRIDSIERIRAKRYLFCVIELISVIVKRVDVIVVIFEHKRCTLPNILALR